MSREMKSCPLNEDFKTREKIQDEKFGEPKFGELDQVFLRWLKRNPLRVES